jgi:lipopolysaccharide export system protein LptA
VIRRLANLCLVSAVLAAWLVGSGPLPYARAQAPVASQANAPRPQNIVLNADAITTWNDGIEQVYLLQGNAWIEQGNDSVRMDNAVVWVDTSNRNVVLPLEVYAYGKALADLGKEKREAEDIVFQFRTSGDVQSNSFKDKILKLDLSGDANYSKLKAARASKKRFPVGIDLAASTGAASSPLLLAQNVSPLQPIPSVPPPATPPNSSPPSLGSLVPPPPDAGQPPFVPPVPQKGAVPRRLSVRPRSSARIQFQTFPQPNGETIVVVPTGVILQITGATEKIGVVDLEADRMVFWTRGNSQQVLTNMQSAGGESNQSMEFYLSGNVEIRSQAGKDSTTLRADEIYYDANTNSAVALRADLELKDKKMPFPIHVTADEVLQINPKLFQAARAQVYSTLLPSDPGFRLEVRDCTIEENEKPRKGLFGNTLIDRETGTPRVEKEHIFTGRNLFLYYEKAPLFWLPYVRGNVEDPLGPLDNVSIGADRPFGFKLLTTWDVYQLFALDRVEGTRWRLFLDYMSRRGPFAGTKYEYRGLDFLGMPSKYDGFLRAYGGYDNAQDIVGADRGEKIFIAPGVFLPVTHPDWRGDVHHRMGIYDLPYGFTVQTQLALISDRNYLEQYYFNDWLMDTNRETSIYVKQQQDFWAWTLLAEPRLQRWYTETQWLPRLEGHLQGLTFFDDFLVLNAKANAAYAMMRVTDEPAFSYNPTMRDIDTGRFDLFGDLSVPFNAGPFRFQPYVKGSVDQYTRDLQGNAFTRLYGGGGVSGSMLFSRLFPDVQSELFNVDTLYHKGELRSNFFTAYSNARYNQFPMLDLLNDNAADQALRDIFPLQSTYNPANAAFLTTSPLVDPQVYLIRRLIENRFDTLDQIEVVQFELRQRLQTRRGLHGFDHVVDWMTFDVAASLFPRANRDNFGTHWGIVQYDWLWNIGDRTALLANGWFEPIENGPRFLNFGTVLSRIDNTSLYLGYRQIDPLESKAVIASFTYQFSPKYAVSANTAYDFGTETQSVGMSIVRTGTDVQLALGLNYNSVLQTFGFQFEIVPTLLRTGRTGVVGPAFGGGGLNNSLGR